MASAGTGPLAGIISVAAARDWPITAPLDITPLMPRHRKQRVPRHWARRPAGRPARRARVSAATNDGVADGRRRHIAAPAAPAGGSARAGRRVPCAGCWWRHGLRLPLGFVVAVGLWISAPHAELKFPSAVGEVPCQVTGCGTQAGQGAGKLTTTKGQPIAHPKKAHGAAGKPGAGRRTAASGLTFAYVVVWQRAGQVRGADHCAGQEGPALLAAGLQDAGRSDHYVAGAAWQPSGADGGTASVQVGQPGDGGNGGNADGPDRSGHIISFTVLGEGTPVAPTGCHFDKATCRFS